jgi:hypothetical protein
MMPELKITLLPWCFITLGAGWFVFAAVMFWRSRQQDRRWQHESRVHQRVQELLAQEYENLLIAEKRHRREAQRQHLAELRAQAEAELAAENSRRGRR